MSHSKQLQINKRPKDDLSDDEEEKGLVDKIQGDEEKKKGKVARITLGHWKSQGPASAARMMLVFGDVDFENVMYEAKATEDGYDVHVSSWTKAKFNLDLDFPNLPYLIDNKTGLRLTASKSIYRYLAKQFAIGVQDDGNMAIADMVQEMVGEVMGVEGPSSRSAPFTVLSYGDFSGKYSDELWAENKAKYLEELPSLLKDLEGFMANKKFVAGHQISYADFPLYYLCLTHNALDPEFSKRFPNLSAFGARFGALEGMERWHRTEMSMLPFNNVMAKFGITPQPMKLKDDDEKDLDEAHQARCSATSALPVNAVFFESPDPDAVGSGKVENSFSTSAGGLGAVQGATFTAAAYSTTEVNMKINATAISQNDMQKVSDLVKGLVSASDYKHLQDTESTSASGGWSLFGGPSVTADASATRTAMSGYGLDEAGQQKVLEMVANLLPKPSTFQYKTTITNPSAFPTSGQMYVYSFTGTVKTENGEKSMQMIGGPVAKDASGGDLPTKTAFTNDNE